MEILLHFLNKSREDNWYEIKYIIERICILVNLFPILNSYIYIILTIAYII